MRIVIAFVLAIVAVVAAGFWALAEFGGSSAQIALSEPVILQEPVVEIAAAQEVQPSSPTPAPHPEQPHELSSDTPIESLTPDAPDPGAPAIRALRSAAPSPAEPLAQVAQIPSAATAASEVANTYRSRRVTYNRPPSRLILDRAIDVSLVINATDNPDAGQEALQGFPGTIVDRDVDLSETVSAQLTGVGFDITSQTVDRQRLSSRTINRWQWRVTPTETGTRTLILEIFGYESGSLDAEPLDAYRDEITVEVEQLDQVIGFARSVQPVFAVLAGVAAALSALFAFLRFRDERKRNRR